MKQVYILLFAIIFSISENVCAQLPTKKIVRQVSCKMDSLSRSIARLDIKIKVDPIPPFKSDVLSSARKFAEKQQGQTLKIAKQLSDQYKSSQASILKSIENRLVNYIMIDCDSSEINDTMSCSMRSDTRKLINYIYDEVKEFDSHIVKVKHDCDFIFVDIPSNIKRNDSTLLFVVRLRSNYLKDTGPINPIVCHDYDGSDILLQRGIIISPQDSINKRLKKKIGNTIITSNGLLSNSRLNEKAACTILISLIEMIAQNPRLPHTHILVAIGSFNTGEETTKNYVSNRFRCNPESVHILCDKDTPMWPMILISPPIGSIFQWYSVEDMKNILGKIYNYVKN